MDNDASSDAHGALIEPNTLKFQRVLPGPIGHVWAYLVQSDLRRQWLAAGDMELKVGSPVEFVWRNDELNSPPGNRPAGFPEEQRLQGQVSVLEVLRKLSIAWTGFGEVSYALEARGDKVLLTMIQRGLPNRDVVVMFAAGSHVHLDILAAILEGNSLPLFWDAWSKLQKDYDLRIAR